MKFRIDGGSSGDSEQDESKIRREYNLKCEKGVGGAHYGGVCVYIYHYNLCKMTIPRRVLSKLTP